MKEFCFNALYRAYSISTEYDNWKGHQVKFVSMPFIGLIPFLQYLPETLAFCGFLSLFLQVFD